MRHLDLGTRINTGTTAMNEPLQQLAIEALERTIDVRQGIENLPVHQQVNGPTDAPFIRVIEHVQKSGHMPRDLAVTQAIQRTEHILRYPGNERHREFPQRYQRRHGDRLRLHAFPQSFDERYDAHCRVISTRCVVLPRLRLVTDSSRDQRSAVLQCSQIPCRGLPKPFAAEVTSMSIIILLVLLTIIAGASVASLRTTKDPTTVMMRGSAYFFAALLGCGMYFILPYWVSIPYFLLVSGGISLLRGEGIGSVDYALASGGGSSLFAEAGVKPGTIDVPGSLQQEFDQLNDAMAKLQQTSSSGVAARAFADTMGRLVTIKKEYARLIIKSAQLAKMSREANVSDLERRHRDMSNQIEKTTDAATKTQLQETARLIEKQLADVRDNDQLAQRLKAKRQAILENIRLAAISLNDVKLVEESRDAIDNNLAEVANDLQDIEAATNRVLASAPRQSQ